MDISNTRHTLGWFALVMLTVGSLSVATQQRYVQGDARISGTYELEGIRGDNPERAADMATRGLPGPQHDRVYQRLLTRLEPPSTLSIDRRGPMITVESSLGPRATFDADGRAHSEQAPNGRTITTRAEIIGDRLTVSTNGNRGSDFTVTFEPLGQGDGLRVTRRFDSEELRQPVTVQSYYRRVANEPRWDIFEADYGGRGARDFVVPDGTRLIATLDNRLSTRTSRGGERFTMTVRSPLEFEGARIDGVLSQVNAYASARNAADMRLNFETIRPRGGQTSEFRAVLRSVRTSDGGPLRVDPEGGVQDRGANDERIEHGAIGAAIGAVIGALAGGGKGAAVGAVVGGAGGAILAEGRDQLDLDPGTEVTMTATAPRSRVSQR
jgi:hypothetical protein